MKKTISYKGFEFKYNLSYMAAEKQTFDYEGNEEEFEITEITLNGIDAEDLLYEQLEEFYNYVIANLKEQKNQY